MFRSGSAGGRTAAIVLLCIGFAACAGAPVQEMSDARQAINAARAAGAAERAPEHFALATDLLTQAEDALQRHDYRSARMQAAQARQRALEALRIATPREKPSGP